MATTFADLEARVCGLESRAQRAEDDVAAIITTVIAARDDVKSLDRRVESLEQDVKWLKRGVAALLADRNIALGEADETDG